VQRWYGLSTGEEAALFDRLELLRFVGLSAEMRRRTTRRSGGSGRRLSKAGLSEPLFAELQRQLVGMVGAVLDSIASLVSECGAPAAG